MDAWFVYCCVLFGIKSGPLVWGRNAALMINITSAMSKDRARTQCFVDDPLITVWGTKLQRDCTLLSIIVLWLVIGCKLSWAKGCRCRRVEWIGAVLQPWMSATCVPGVTLTITKEKIVQLASQCDELLKARAPVEKSLATWVAGILPQISVYTASLWAASSTKHSHVAIQQMWTSLVWLRQLRGEDLEQIQHHCRSPSGYFSLITFDSSLSGGGAILPPGLQTLEQAATKPIVAYWRSTRTEEDRTRVGVKLNDPSGQAALEAYTLPISVATWIKVLKGAQGALHLRGDALGVLHSMLRLKSKDPVLNAVAGELAYVVASLALDIRAAHVWSERNAICDSLSRLQPGEQCSRPQIQGAAKVKRQRVLNFLLKTLVGD